MGGYWVVGIAGENRVIDVSAQVHTAYFYTGENFNLSETGIYDYVVYYWYLTLITLYFCRGLWIVSTVLQVYVHLHDEPHQADNGNDRELEAKLSSSELKKLKNKQRRQQRKKAAEAEKKKLEQEKNNKNRWDAIKKYLKLK